MRVKFITFGCSRNQADSELMKGLLVKAGHEIVNDNEEITVINTCFVKGETEKKVLKTINKARTRVVITGCLAQARPTLIEAYPTASIIGVKQINRIVEAVNKQVVNVNEGVINYCQKKVRQNKLISIIPISTGCLGNCTYCSTRQARGVLQSREISDIVRQVRSELREGVKEVWLTSEDNGCYGFDKGVTLTELLDELLRIKNNFKIRVGMMNPQHVKKYQQKLIRVMSDERVYKFIHVPVQSGSDKVLQDMNRGYTVSDFKEVINTFKEYNISTDVICGYPTETREDFNKTIQLIREVKPGVLNISKYYPRPGTKASMLKQIISREVKERSRELTRIYNELSLKQNKKKIGREYKVLINEPGKGRNKYYQQVIVKAPIGREVRVRIIDASIHALKGKII